MPKLRDFGDGLDASDGVDVVTVLSRDVAALALGSDFGAHIESAEGFWVSLPSGRSEAAMIGCVNRSVLVVDDDPEFRKLARRVLVACGLTVVGEAESVAAARAAAARFEPSAVLIDVELPDGDGVTLARELAVLPWRPRIVLTSIDGEITTPTEACNAGALAFINKADLPNAPLAQLLGGE
jgi:CheY-like chemotaxis protein